MGAADVPAAGGGPATTATGAVSAAADDEEAALIAAGQAVMPPAAAAAAPLAPPPAPVAPDSAAGQVLVAADDEDGPIKVSYVLALRHGCRVRRAIRLYSIASRLANRLAHTGGGSLHLHVMCRFQHGASAGSVPGCIEVRGDAGVCRL